MILATCQHHNLKPYTFQSEFRIVYCCLVCSSFERNDENQSSHKFYEKQARQHFPYCVAFSLSSSDTVLPLTELCKKEDIYTL